jgi:cell division protein FtsQ
MDGRGRVAQPLKRPSGPRAAARARFPTLDLKARLSALCGPAAALVVRTDRFALPVAQRVAAVKPRHAGTIAAVLLIAASAGYGVMKGGHAPALLESLADARDSIANAAGFRITALAITGRRRLSEAEVLAAAGVTDRTSLLFLDVEAARRKLEASPWIVQATVRKLYPGQLEIAVSERDAFAIWQRDGKLSIIADDGTVLGVWGEREMQPLPLVVGEGAASRARAFLTLLDRYPSLRDEVRAAVLVAERRWNLKFKSGLDVRLPEEGAAQALETLMVLDREKKLLSRDLTAIDLRLPGRVTVRLSDEAAKAREEAAKAKKKQPRRGGPA